jgi:sigma-E factor negative regulatory protein RseB
MSSAVFFQRTCLLASAFFLVNTIFVRPSLADQADDGWKILQKSAVAAHTLSYRGIFIYESSRQTKAVQITHMNNGNGEYSRNVLLDSSPREVFSQGRDLVIFNPKKEKIIIQKRRGQNLFPAILPTQLEHLKASYALYVGETDNVAGRSARQLMLVPKDNFRYQYKFWVDQEYGLLLKYCMQNAKQETLESIAFNQVDLMESLDLNWFRPQIITGKNYEMENEIPSEDVPDLAGSWEIQTLPAGFNKVAQVRLMAHGKTTPVTQIVLSDGLATVSLFIEPVRQKPRLGYHMMGNNSFYAHVQNGYQITAVGEVPQETVAKIAESVMFKK